MASGGETAAAPAYTSALHALLVRADRGNTTDAVHQALREAILSGILVAPAWLREDELATAMQRIGELSMEVELLRSRIERAGPLGRRRSR